MTPEQISADISYYYWLSQDLHADACFTIRSIDAYSDAQKRLAMAEVAYWHDKKRLPKWGTIIERVDVVDDNVVFVHRDICAIL